MESQPPRKDNAGDERASASTGAVRKTKEEKNRKRDHRSWENLEKEIADLSDNEKLCIVKDKYIDMFHEMRNVRATLRSVERQLTVSNKEKDHFQTELSRAVLHKTKLEGLCRELQKQNKQVKEEYIARIKEEEERRREVATSFTDKLNTLTSLMDDNKDKSVRLREENLSMTTKLTELYDQFQERESHLATVNRQMDIQKKLSDAQFRKLELEFQNAREIWEKERQTLLSNLDKNEHSNMLLQETIKHLEEHIDVYKLQYSDFESTMHKSNKVFDAFKEELGKMSKAKALLEKERNDYRQRWQTCTNSIVQMTEMHQQTTGELKAYHKKIAMLEKLCRQLHADRAAYLQQLESNKINPIAPPQLEESKGEIHASVSPAPKFTSAEKKQLFAKEKLISALKTELKVMEDQLKLTTQQEGDGDKDIQIPSTSGLQRPSGDHTVAVLDNSSDELPHAVPSVASTTSVRSRKTRRPLREEMSDTSPEYDEAMILKPKLSGKRKAKKVKKGKSAAGLKPVTLQKEIALRQQPACIMEEDVSLKIPETIVSAEYIIDSPRPGDNEEPTRDIPLGESFLTAQYQETEASTEAEDDMSSRSDASTIRLQKPRSAPVTKKEHSELPSAPSTSSSTEVLFADLSLDAVPLFRTEGVVDLAEGVCLVKESEARTNLLEPMTSSDVDETEADSEAKTEIKKEGSK